jgi:hypothetical protein
VDAKSAFHAVVVDFVRVFYYYFKIFVLLIQRWNCTFDINTLNNMGLLRTLLIVLAGYFLLRLLWTWLAPKLFAYAVRKAEARFRDAFGMTDDKNEERPGHIGDISFQQQSRHKNKENEKVGEYIEFEEID